MTGGMTGETAGAGIEGASGPEAAGSGGVLGGAGPGTGRDAPGGGPAGPVGPAGTAGLTGLSVRGLTVAYGDLQAVCGVDLDVAPGEVVALLGASGCGKSSLLRAVAGLEDVTAGQVRWDGRDMVGVPVHRRGFGLMFQDGQLFEHRDVAGNVAYGLAGLPRAQRIRRVEEMLALVGLSGLSGRAVCTLSGGQAQRVALARSLAPSPRLLLLDEPLSALDRALREQLAVDLRAILRQQGTTALYVTHDQDEAMTVADRVGVMSQGRLLRLDAPGRLWADPGSREVAQFLGFGPFLDLGEGTGLPGLLERAQRASQTCGDGGVGEPGRAEPGGPRPAPGVGGSGPGQAAGGSGGCLALAPGALRVEDQAPSPQGAQGEGRPGEEAQAQGARRMLRAGQERLTGTVEAARLRRGQWEAEVVLHTPGWLQTPGSEAPGVLDVPGGSETLRPETPGDVDAPGGVETPGSEAPGGPETLGPEVPGDLEASLRSGSPAAPGAPGGSVAPVTVTPDLPDPAGLARAVALAGRAHQPGERVVLLLDLARTALVPAGDAGRCP